MKRHLIPILLPLLALLFTTACNNDIFIGADQLPENTDIYLESTDNTSIYLSTDDLLHITVESTSAYPQYITFYDIDGHPIPADSPADDIREIIIDDVRTLYTIGIHGNYLYFNSNYNCSGDVDRVMLRLEFTYGTRLINFIIDSGEKLTVLHAFYDEALEVTPGVEKIRRTFTFRNHSTVTQYLDWQPYEHANATAILKPADLWARDCEIPLSLPVMYRPDEWGLHDDGYILPCFRKFNYPPFNSDKVEKIEIPPMTTLHLASTVSYSKVVGHGVIDIHNPVTDITYDTKFTCTCFYPASYEIETVDEQ